MSSLWYGDKISLKPIDEEKLFQYLNSKDYYDTSFQRLVGSVDVPLSPNRLKEEITKMVKDSNTDHYFWMIEDLNGNIVGDINTYHCDRRNGTFTFGVAILREYWRKGYAREAIKIVLQFFFYELRYQKANSHVYSFNEASLKLHENLGFVQEGRRRNMVYANGKYYDHIYYGMTKDEYENLYLKDY